MFFSIGLRKGREGGRLGGLGREDSAGRGGGAGWQGHGGRRRARKGRR